MNHSNVRFVGCSVDLHLGEILRDGEQSRCLQRGGYGLPNIDATRDHSAVDGSVDCGVVQIVWATVTAACFCWYWAAAWVTIASAAIYRGSAVSALALARSSCCGLRLPPW